MEWYLGLSLYKKLTFVLLILAFIVVMTRCFIGLHRNPWSWYRGVQSTPFFQFVMWIGAIPFIVPAVILWRRRSNRLKNARFIGNVRSYVYHKPECGYQQKIRSSFFRFPLSSKDEAIRRGFRPCPSCHPNRGSSGA